jgi:hypothetical protein
MLFRQTSNTHLKVSNITQPDFAISDEDLLSNVDRVSKLLPKEIDDEDYENMNESDP